MKKYSVFAFVLSTLFLMLSCTKNSNHGIEKETFSQVREIIDAPQGSRIKQYIHQEKTNNYKLVITENLGHHRQATETVMLGIDLSENIHDVSFKFKQSSSIALLKTPLILLELYDRDKNLLATLKQHGNYAWLEQTPNSKIQRVPLYLDTQDTHIIINKSSLKQSIKIDTETFDISANKPITVVNLGIKRTDLLRYKGQHVPEQILEIENLTQQ